MTTTEGHRPILHGCTAPIGCRAISATKAQQFYTGKGRAGNFYTITVCPDAALTPIAQVNR
jgi:hypothetical protein